MKETKICLLTDCFFEDYPHDLYKELEYKKDRPYLVLLIKIDGLTFALPFRTNISHNYCFAFKKTGKKSNNKTGIDFTKAIILNKEEYIGKEAFIDLLEFKEVKTNENLIINRFISFLSKYKEIMNEPNKSIYEYERFSKYSTLKYFHKELGIWLILTSITL